MTNFEKRFGKYAIKNLTLALILGYALGYIITLVDNFRGTNFISFLQLDPWKIIHGQVWRLITWVLIPPSDYSGFSGILFLILMMWCCLSIGTVLEKTWGTYRYNLYIFGGILLTVLSSFLTLLLFYLVPGLFDFNEVSMLFLLQTGSVPWSVFSTFFINMSIYMGFAITYPDNMVRFMFFIPMKMKWLGIIDGLYFAYYLYNGIRLCTKGSIYSMYGTMLIMSVLAALLNILIFWLFNLRRGSSLKQKFRQQKFKREYNQGVYNATNRFNTGADTASGYQRYSGGEQKTGEGPSMKNPGSITRHKCAICGQTEVSNPSLEFRFCSKCNGNYEYCSNHLFSHEHIR